MQSISNWVGGEKINVPLEKRKSHFSFALDWRQVTKNDIRIWSTHAMVRRVIFEYAVSWHHYWLAYVAAYTIYLSLIWLTLPSTEIFNRSSFSKCLYWLSSLPPPWRAHSICVFFFFFLSYSLLARRAHFPHFFMTNSCPRVCAREGGGRRVSSLPLYPPAFHYSLTCVDVSVRLVYVPRFDRIRPASFHRQPCNRTLSPDFQIFISRSFYFYFFAYFFFPFPLHHFLSHSPWILISIRRGDGVGILFWTKSYRENWA